jgi:hypothetical protein
MIHSWTGWTTTATFVSTVVRSVPAGRTGMVCRADGWPS